MPLYEYHCRGCAADFERVLKFEQRLEPQACPVCKSEQTSLRFSMTAIGSSNVETHKPGFVGACRPGCGCASHRN